MGLENKEGSEVEDHVVKGIARRPFWKARFWSTYEFKSLVMCGDGQRDGTMTCEHSRQRGKTVKTPRQKRLCVFQER